MRGEGRALLGGVMFLGMAFTLPVTETVRYTIGMIVIWLVVKICEWIDHKCLTVTAAIASAVVTVSLNICGELLTNTVRGDLPVKLMEGVICFASVFSATNREKHSATTVFGIPFQYRRRCRTVSLLHFRDSFVTDRYFKKSYCRNRFCCLATPATHFCQEVPSRMRSAFSR